MPSECYPDATPHLGLDRATPSAGAIGWGVVTTHSQAERWASANLQRWGYATYLPLVTVLRRDRVLRTLTRRVPVPLFPRYLFVHFTGSAWGVASAPGVKSLLMSGGQPAIVPEAEILALQAGEELRSCQIAATPLWRPGAASSQAWGPFQGRPSVVKAVRGEKAVVTLLMLGGLRDVTVPLDCLVLREE